MTPLAPAWQWLEDPEGQWTLSEALARSAEFQPLPAELRQRAPRYSRAALWARMELPAAAQAEDLRLNITMGRIELAQLWLEAPDGQWRLHAEAGLQIPHDQWPLDTADASFVLRSEAGRPLHVMLRTLGRTVTSFDALLCRPSECQGSERHTHWVITVLAGNQMLAAVAYLLLFCLQRHRALVLVSGAVAAYGLYEFSLHGLGFQYLWPHATDWAQRNLLVLMTLAQLLQSLAVAAILPWRRVAWPLPTVLIAVWIGMAGSIPIALWGNYKALGPAVNTLAAVCALLTLGLAAWAWHRRFPLANWATWMMLAAALGSLPRYAFVMGWIGVGPIVRLTTPTVLLLSHLILLAALVQRMDRLRRSELAVQAQLLDERGRRAQELELQVEHRTGQLREALLDARVQHQQRSRLLAYIGHDLRAPLAATVSYLRLLGGRGRRDQQLRASVEQGVTYQLALIDELVEFSRGELQELDLVPAPLYIHGLLHALAEQGELLARGRNNSFRARLAADLPAVVVADAKRLRQVLLNLLSNAAKFTAHGRIELSVMRGKAPQHWRFEVSDSGGGIRSEDQQRLFEPFWQASPQRGEEKAVGSGLGLAVAHHIVKAMGSKIELHSAVGRGSCFLFELALAEGKAEEVLLPADGVGLIEASAPDLRALLIDAPLSHADRVAEILFAVNVEVERLGVGDALVPADLLLCDPALLDAAGLAHVCQWRQGAPERRCIALIAQPLETSLQGLFDAELYKPVNAAALLAERFGAPD